MASFSIEITKKFNPQQVIIIFIIVMNNLEIMYLKESKCFDLRFKPLLTKMKKNNENNLHIFINTYNFNI